MNGSEEESQNNEDRKYSLASVKAKTADIAKLEEARRMLAEGIDKEEVWQKTGWYIAKDGKPRFEISDKNYALNDNFFEMASEITPQNDTYCKLADIVDHEELFKAYPHLRKIQVRIYSNPESDLKAGSHPEGIEINIKDKNNIDSEAIRKSLIHELQHAIQKYEGFAVGSSPFVERIKLKGEKGRKHRFSAEELSKIKDEGYDRYRRHYGEGEARTTSRRVDYEDSERLNTMPEDDFDYDVDNSILEFDENNQTDSSVQRPSPNVRYSMASKEIGSLQNKINTFIDELRGKKLTSEQKHIADVFTKRERIYKIKDLKKVKDLYLKSQSRDYGTNHILLNHFKTKSYSVTTDEILDIVNIIRRGKLSEGKKGDRLYSVKAKDGANLTVVVKKDKKGDNTIFTFYSDRNPRNKKKQAIRPTSGNILSPTSNNNNTTKIGNVNTDQNGNQSEDTNINDISEPKHLSLASDGNNLKNILPKEERAFIKYSIQFDNSLSSSLRAKDYNKNGTVKNDAMNAIVSNIAERYLANPKSVSETEKNILKEVYDSLKKENGSISPREAMTWLRDSQNSIEEQGKLFAKDSLMANIPRFVDDRNGNRVSSSHPYYSLLRESELKENSDRYFDTYYNNEGKKKNNLVPINDNPNLTREVLDECNLMIDEMREMMEPFYDKTVKGRRYLPEEVYGATTLFDNASYGKTMENTTICWRTLAFNHFSDAVKKKLGRPLTVKESFLVSQKIYDMGTDPQCLYCYVSLDRKSYDEALLKYIEQRDKAMEDYKANVSDREARLDELPQKKADRKEHTDKLAQTELGKVYMRYLNGRDDTPAQRERFNSWLDVLNSGNQFIDGSALATKDIRKTMTVDKVPQAWKNCCVKIDAILADEKLSEGAKRTRINKFKKTSEYRNAWNEVKNTAVGQIADAEQYAQAASWQKKEEDYRSYTGELLTTNRSALDKIMSHYGLRFYSFSEFIGAFILENMQMVRDAALRGLKGFAYSKKADFAKIFAPSGMNFNIGCYGRRDSKGNVVMDERQGANWDEVKQLREKYDGVGAVFVAVDDDMVRWALDQDWIDVVIPFHIVRTGDDIAKYYGWVNFKGSQEDKIELENGKTKTDNIYPNQHKNSKEIYLKLAREKGWISKGNENNKFTPRFEQFIDHPNYMKLVNETRRTADETPVLTPVFDMDAAKKAFKDFTDVGGYYNNYYRPEYDFDAEVNRVADDIRAGKEPMDVDYGRQDLPMDYFDEMEKTAKNKRKNREHGRKYSLASVKAKTADIAKLEEARRMLAEGIDKKEVWQKTGWYIGKDGKPRFEIADKITFKRDYSYIVNNCINSGNSAWVSSLINNKPLFKAYPFLENINVYFHRYLAGKEGYYDPNDNSIHISLDGANPSSSDSKYLIARTLTHELQHAIQSYEGFAKGTSVEAEKDKVMMNQLRERSQLLSDIDQTINSIEEPERRKLAEEYRDLMFEYVKSKGNKDEYTPRLESLKSEFRKDYGWASKDNENFEDELDDIEYDIWNIQDIDTSAKDEYFYNDAKRNYYRNYGEGEARVAEKRLDYADFERAEIMPEEDFDYNIDDSIIEGVEYNDNDLDDGAIYSSENNGRRYSIGNGNYTIGFDIDPVGFRMIPADRASLQTNLLAHANPPNQDPRMSGVVFANGFYYPYIRQGDETFIVLKPYKKEKNAQKRLEKGVYYKNAYRRRINQSGKRYSLSSSGYESEGSPRNTAYDEFGNTGRNSDVQGLDRDFQQEEREIPDYTGDVSQSNRIDRERRRTRISNRHYSLSSGPDNKSDVEKIKDYIDGKVGIKLSDDDMRDLKTLMGTDKDSDLDLNDIPTMKNQAETIKEKFVNFLNGSIPGIFGDLESKAERKKSPYLWQKDHNTEPEIETPFEISRRHKIEEGMKIREEEDRLVLQHLDADKNFFTGLVRKHFEPGPLRDWILKKVSRILAPFQMMKPVENLLFTVAENIMWDEAKQQMVIAPQRTTLEDPQTHKPIGYKYEDNKVKGNLALDIYNNRLNDDFKAIIIERAKANNEFREDFVNRVVPLEQAKLYLAKYARTRLNGASQNIIDGNDRQAYSYITKLKGVIDDIDYNDLISKYDQIHNIPVAQLGRNASFVNSIIGELTDNPSITAGGIDGKLNWITSNKGIYGYAHHIWDFNPTTDEGQPFNALGKIKHPWIEAIAGDQKGRIGENTSYRSLLKADLERSRKENTAEAANRWMQAIEDTYGITIEEAKTLEKLKSQGKGKGMPKGYERMHRVVANFGKFRGKVIFLPDEVFEAYRITKENNSFDNKQALPQFFKWYDKVNSRINLAMLWHPAKAMRDLMAGPFHLLEFLRDWSIKHPTEINDALKATWKGIKNSVSPEYWQSHTPESMGEYNESVVYQNSEDQSLFFEHLDKLGRFFQKAVPIGQTAEAFYNELNFSGAADIPLKRIFTTIGEEIADKRGLTGVERERFIYDMVNDYAFDTGDLPEILAWLRGKKPNSASQQAGQISRSVLPFMGYATRMIKQMITDPVTKGAVPLTKRAFGKADSDSNLRSEISEISRPFFWLMLKAMISAGLGGILPPPAAEDVQDMPGLPPSARTHGRFYVGDSDKGERFMSYKGMGQMETASAISDVLSGKSDIKDFSAEFLTIHPLMKFIANYTGMTSEYDRKVPITAQAGKTIANLIYPEASTRFMEDITKLIGSWLKWGITDSRKQGFINAFIQKLTGIQSGAVLFDSEGHMRLSDPALESLKMLGINIREIPFDTIEETTRAEASRIANDSKKIEKLKDYRAGKYSPKTEQEFLKQDFGGDFSSVDEAEKYYSNIADRERKVVDTATKLYNKGHWTDLEDVAREKKELASEKKKQQNEGKPTKRRRTTRRRKTERPLLNDDLNYINNDIRKNIYKSREEEYQDLYNKLMQNNKKHNPRRGVAGQLERLLNEMK